MAKIYGNTVTTPMPVADWNQTDENKADYIKNKPTVLTEEDVLGLISENGGGNGGATSEQIEETVKEYLEKNPITGTEEVYTVVVKQNTSNEYSLVQGNFNEIKNAYSNKKVIVMYDITLGHCAMLWLFSGVVATFCCNTSSELHAYDVHIDNTVGVFREGIYTAKEVDNRINAAIGDINSALNELHNYAQALIGGASE